MTQAAKFEEIANDNPIIPAPTAIETFRDSGYKSTAAALAELIDNSIEAEARTIQVLTFEEPVTLARRTVQRISKIAVYDDGKGMDPYTLMGALQFGMGTRLQSRKGIGRFGIGLPNASVSQCQHVEVYSWQGGKCYKTYLNLDEVRKNKQQNSNPVVACNLPMEILSEIEGKLDEDSGTLIVWSECDRLDINRSTTLYNNMERDLCRIYRHFLDNDNNYGNKVDVKLIVTGKERHVMKLMANDPIYLLTPNNTPGYENQNTNISHGDVIKIPVPYDDKGNTSIVEMRFTVALPEIQALGGNSKVGQHYKRNTGISFVRACREIDFGDFGFFNPQDERQRWWGCEVRFEPVLDELFGVTNNKQSVRGVRYINIDEFKREHGSYWEEELKENPKLQLLYELSRHFHSNHKTIKDGTIDKRNEGARSSGDIEFEEKSTKVANDLLKNSKEETKSHIVGQEKSSEEKLKEWKDSLEGKEPNLTEEELGTLAEQKSSLIIDFDFDVWPGEQFFTVETRGETQVIIINKKHSFYTELYEPLCMGDDPRLSNALNLMMLAYARVEDELFSYDDLLQEIRSKWGNYVQKFLKALKEEA
ncbi:MAG: ATP-binding protein [Micavibrio sp.]